MLPRGFERKEEDEFSGMPTAGKAKEGERSAAAADDGVAEEDEEDRDADRTNGVESPKSNPKPKLPLRLVKVGTASAATLLPIAAVPVAIPTALRPPPPPPRMPPPASTRKLDDEDGGDEEGNAEPPEEEDAPHCRVVPAAGTCWRLPAPAPPPPPPPPPPPAAPAAPAPDEDEDDDPTAAHWWAGNGEEAGPTGMIPASIAAVFARNASTTVWETSSGRKTTSVKIERRRRTAPLG
jgi:hypothetical protein